MTIRRWWRNRVGRLKGYGCCLRCHDTWDWKPHHTTDYKEGEGCFPLCEACWTELTIQERVPYYLRLWQLWKTDDATWHLIHHAVLEGK